MQKATFRPSALEEKLKPAFLVTESRNVENAISQNVQFAFLVAEKQKSSYKTTIKSAFLLF